MPYWALVPATGIGSRMGADRPKQYLQLGTQTILETTLQRLLQHPEIEGLVVVLHPQDNYWAKLDFHSEKPVLLAAGGTERSDSVLSGLTLLQQHLQTHNGAPETVQVLIHDAVRPCITQADLSRLMREGASHTDGALLALPVADTLKQANQQDCAERTVPRSGLWRALTPQMFCLPDIVHALQEAQSQGLAITDDASAFELQGRYPLLVEGRPDNLKITYAADLSLALSLLRAQENERA